MITVQGPAGSAIANVQQLGLADSPITVSLDFRHSDVQVDAWGRQIPPEVQVMLASATISMNLIHFDRDILDECWRLSMGGPAAIGQVARAGTRLGNSATLQTSTTNMFMALGIASPVANKPWRFRSVYLTGTPGQYPLGTEKRVVVLNWRAIVYPGTNGDPWQAGLGANNQILWDYVALT